MEWRVALGGCCLSLSLAMSAGAATPRPVSPAHPTGVTVVPISCPTFSWSAPDVVAEVLAVRGGGGRRSAGRRTGQPQHGSVSLS